MEKKQYAQDGPLQNKLDYGKIMKKKQSKLYTQANLSKYASMDKQALIKKAILADFIIQSLKYVLDMLRPYSWLFSANRKLKQIFEMVEELVRTRE